MAKTVTKAKRSAIRITKSTVEALPLPLAGGRGVLWDSEVKGFGVRVTSAGIRTYVMRYQIGGRKAPQRQVTIGQHGSPWTADQARKRALELLYLVRNGSDPAATMNSATKEREDHAARRASRMFGILADRWFERHVKGSGLRSVSDVEGLLRRDLKPAFANLSIDEIDKKALAKLFEALGGRSPAAANKAHKWLRQHFNWLIEKGEIEHSPLDRVKRPFPEPSRTRFLSLLELVVVWVACDSLPEPFRSFYRLLILLGQRLREVSNLPWSELDLETGEWLLPAERSKNKLPHLIPLPDEALAILKARKTAATPQHGPVLTTYGAVGISGFSKMKEALDDSVREVLAKHPEVASYLGTELKSWVVHDLRRSLATHCQGLSTSMDVTEAIRNHVTGRRGGVRGVYQLYDYYDEKADALARWGKLVTQAVEAWHRGDLETILSMDPSRQRRRRRQSKGDQAPSS